METQNNVQTLFPVFQSTNIVDDKPAKVEGVKVRSVTRVFNEQLGKDVQIINLDLTTQSRLASVRKAFKEAVANGATEPVQERNLSYNVLPVFGTDDDFSSKYVPVKGEYINCQLDYVQTKAGDTVIVVTDIYPMQAVTARKANLKEMFEADAIEAAPAPKVEADATSGKGKGKK